MSTISIPLSKLRLSPLNVRHPTDGDVANKVHGLQASILAHGLMNPLVVHKLTKPKGTYGVIAGGRRLRALQGLAEDGRIAKDHIVDCYESTAGASAMTEMSLIENIERAALKPTAEYEAFAKLANDGDDEAAIAERFGTTILHVRQRMRLGRLHPDILAALDEHKITLDHAKAYAATEDQALQARVFAELSKGYNHQPYNIRNAIRGAGAALNTDKMLRVVGVAAYTEAGGQLEEDLFEGGFRVLQPGTLNDLYYAKVEEQESALAATLPPSTVITTSPVDLGRWIVPKADLDDAQRDRLLAIDKRSEEIQEQIEQLAELVVDDNIDGPGTEAIVADKPENQPRVDALRAELDVLQDESEVINSAAKVELPDGPIVVLAEPSSAGLVIKGYYRPKGFAEPGEGAGTRGSLAPAASLDRPIGLEPSSGYGGPNAAAAATRAEHGLTADGIEVMRSQRRSILRAMMVDGQESCARRIASWYLPFVVLRSMLPASYSDRSGCADLGIAQGLFAIAREPNVAGLDSDIAAQPAAGHWNAALADLAQAEWMIEPDLQRGFSLFCELDEEDVEYAGAVASAMLLDRSLRAPGYAVALHDQLGFAIGACDDQYIRERYWTPNVAFFERLPKSRRLAAVAEISERASKVIAKMPTADISAACARFFAADKAAIAEFQMVDVQAKYARLWVPAFLRLAEGPSDVDRAKGFKLLEEQVAA